MGDVANCLNSIRKSHLSIDDDESTSTANIISLLRFVFIGDSRIRQQFFNFLKVFVIYYFIEVLTTLHLGVRRFKSENGKNSGFSGIFWIFSRFLDFLDFIWTFFVKKIGFFPVFMDFGLFFVRIFWIFWIFSEFFQIFGTDFLGCTKTFLSGQTLGRFLVKW